MDLFMICFSAVDVDSAVCLADEEDQIKDIIDLIYRLRHTENTADLMGSTEYALFRFLIKWNDTTNLFKIMNDPINYGVFMNEHAYCLVIDHLLKRDNITGTFQLSIPRPHVTVWMLI